MKILVISDTHGRMDGVKKAVASQGPFDLVIHLGDLIGQDRQLKSICNCPVKIVQGNCDYGSEYPIADIVEFGEKKAFITHGHHYGVEWGLNQLCYAAEGNGCNFAMYGHTHRPEIMEMDGVTVMNPGSISRPRQMNRKKSYIIIEIKDGKASSKICYIDW